MQLLNRFMYNVFLPFDHRFLLEYLVNWTHDLVLANKGFFYLFAFLNNWFGSWASCICYRKTITNWKPGNWLLFLKLLWNTAETVSGDCINPSLLVTACLPCLSAPEALSLCRGQWPWNMALCCSAVSLFVCDLWSLIALAVAAVLVCASWRGSCKGQEFVALSWQGEDCSDGEREEQRWCLDRGGSVGFVGTPPLASLYVSINNIALH